MPTGKLVFAQLMEFLPLHTFRRCVAHYPSSYPTKTFSHLDHYLFMAFAQLIFRESLRDNRPDSELLPYSEISVEISAPA